MLSGQETAVWQDREQLCDRWCHDTGNNCVTGDFRTGNSCVTGQGTAVWHDFSTENSRVTDCLTTVHGLSMMWCYWRSYISVSETHKSTNIYWVKVFLFLHKKRKVMWWCYYVPHECKVMWKCYHVLHECTAMWQCYNVPHECTAMWQCYNVPHECKWCGSVALNLMNASDVVVLPWTSWMQSDAIVPVPCEFLSWGKMMW